jgi:tetratricopeptide (TPR) repeat protein
VRSSAPRVDDERTPRRIEPALPADVTGDELDRQVRSELSTLSRENAVVVARHLVMVARLMDDEPELAYEHAVAAQQRAGRVGLVREAAGLAAYQVGRYEEALRELRTARRLTGSSEHLPVMADCERGLGRPERALDLASSPEARELDRAGQLEMLIVASGARGDLGQHDAAVVMLQVGELDVPPRAGSGPARQARARLMSAYADALAAAGRADEAQQWLEKAADADLDGSTGAAERLGRVEDSEIYDLLEDDEDEAGTDEREAAPVAEDTHVDATPDEAADDLDESGDEQDERGEDPRA